jgi:hypothetical protein
VLTIKVKLMSTLSDFVGGDDQQLTSTATITRQHFHRSIHAYLQQHTKASQKYTLGAFDSGRIGGSFAHA